MSRTRWAVDGPDGTAVELDGRKFGASDEGAPMLVSLITDIIYITISFANSSASVPWFVIAWVDTYTWTSVALLLLMPVPERTCSTAPPGWCLLLIALKIGLPMRSSGREQVCTQLYSIKQMNL
jgi:hypothetical protein